MGHPKGTYRSFFQEKNSRWVREGKDFAGQQIPYQQTVGDTASHSKSRIIESLFREAEIQRLPCPSPICQLSPNSALNLYGNFLFSKFSTKKKRREITLVFPPQPQFLAKKNSLKLNFCSISSNVLSGKQATIFLWKRTDSSIPEQHEGKGAMESRGEV